MNYWQSIVLGAVQGLAEFIPISSSGHLAIIQKMMGLDPSSPAMLTFDLASHIGTLVSMVLVFAGTFAAYLRRVWADLFVCHSRSVAARITGQGILATAVTGTLGMLFKEQLEAAFSKTALIGVALLITGSLLFITVHVPRPRKGWRRFGWTAAGIVGLTQAAAITPGISRSGTTICTAMLLGLKRRWAAEFSFFIAVPAILGAAVIKGKDALELPGPVWESIAWGPIVVGTICAAVVGFLALRWLLFAVRRAQLSHFAYYCWAAGLTVIVLSLTGNL